MTRFTSSNFVVLFFSAFATVVSGQTDCGSQDTALLACLTLAGVGVVGQTTCTACVSGAAQVAGLVTDGGVVGDDGTLACTGADTAACAAFSVCPCSDCTAEAEAKGLCDIDAARATSEGTCPAASCDIELPPILKRSEAPSESPSMAPSVTPPSGANRNGCAAAMSSMMLVVTALASFAALYY